MTQIQKMFSGNLKRIRKSKKLTLEQLAERLDVTLRYVQKLEGPSCPNVRLDTIAALAKALDVKPRDFLE